MATPNKTRRHEGNASRSGLREKLLAGIPLTERRCTCAGIDTAVLEGGRGAPVVLLHGPGESAVNWRWTAPDLVTTHRVVAPDLPAHGQTSTGPERPDEDAVLAWLDSLIEQTCPEPPTLVGHVLGGAIAARFAIGHADRLDRLVLVDSLGLGRFRPSPRFAMGFLGFVLEPTVRRYERFMRQCAFDLDTLRADMGHDWDSFVEYNLEIARDPKSKVAGRLFRTLGPPRIPPERLTRLRVPTTLIWGRQDRATRLRVAEAASERLGWPLHVIDDAADDPMRDRPEAFTTALRSVLEAA